MPEKYWYAFQSKLGKHIFTLMTNGTLYYNDFSYLYYNETSVGIRQNYSSFIYRFFKINAVEK